MGKNYEQLSIEERAMIQTQLEMGIRPAAITGGFRHPRRETKHAILCPVPHTQTPNERRRERGK